MTGHRREQGETHGERRLGEQVHPSSDGQGLAKLCARVDFVMKVAGWRNLPGMPLRRSLLVALLPLASLTGGATGCSGVAASIEDTDGTQGPSSSDHAPGSSGDSVTSDPGAPDAAPTGTSGTSAPGDAGTAATADATTVPGDGGNGPSRDAAAGSDAAADAAPPPTCTGALPDPGTGPSTVDLSCFTSTFADDFSSYDISSGPVADGKNANERWFNGTDECCMSPSNGWPGVMYPTTSQATQQPVNPYSLLPGGGLQISLTEQNDEWFSGVMTTVDANENGFAQAYGYFEMTTKLPAGTGTWPSFWMLSLPRSAPGGEIDIFEQLGCSPPLNPEVEKIFHFTLHDWKGGTTPFATRRRRFRI